MHIQRTLSPVPLLLLLLGSALQAAAGDFDAGMSAFDRGDYAAAHAAFEPLAQQGNGEAQYMLGYLYATGKGVAKNETRAYQWFLLADEGGVPEARQSRDDLARRMTATQVDQAMEAAENWRPRPAGATRSVTAPPHAAPDPPATDVGALVRELRRLARKAEQGNAAEPWLLQEMRRLATRYDPTPREPPPRLMLREDFSDGELDRHPSWDVVQGLFKVDRDGLRTISTHAVRRRPSTDPQGLAEDILDTMRGPSTDTRTIGEIHVARELQNDFRLVLEFTANAAGGRLEFGPYAGAGRQSGYRLWLDAGGEGETLLARLAGARDSSIVASRFGVPDLTDGKRHRITWRRRDGHMQVRLDEQLLLDGNDRHYGQAFAGFDLRNLGGDFSVHKVLVFAN